MSTHHYAGVPYPWRAKVDLSSPHPARFYARLVSQAVRYGLPASRPGGTATAWVARLGLPYGAATKIISKLPRTQDRDTDDTLSALTEEWTALVSRSSRLPHTAPELSALVLMRSAAKTIFLFGDGPDPVLVAKIPDSGDRSVDKEVAALEEIAAHQVAPKYLGTIATARVQEALPGTPLEVEPVSASSAASLRWTSDHAAVGRALETIARASAKEAVPDEVGDEITQLALKDTSLDQKTKRCVSDALGSLGRLDTAVLKHGDTSAQNCLVDRDGAYLVDWEGARTSGGPGFDVWNLALAYLEHGVGLKRWSQEDVLAAFRNAWDAPFFHDARAAAARATLAAGVEDDQLRPLEIAFFARRLAHRMVNPKGFPTTAATARAMLETVCAS